MKSLLLFLFLPLMAIANDSVHVEMGIPHDINSEQYIIIRPQYALDYISSLGQPRWVAWNLNKDWYGDVDRYSGNFITDTSLPTGIMRIKHSDYTNSGFDRGHMVRSEERTQTVSDNKSTFLMTNIIPQIPELNRNTWLDLEYYCEDLCKNGNKELFIYSGPHFPAQLQFINDKVAIPDSCFKIIVILERGQHYTDVSNSTKIIAVMMPNNTDVKNHEWTEYTRTVRQIEESTGLDFFTNLPQDLQDIIETKLLSSVPLDKSLNLNVYPNPAFDAINVSGACGTIYVYSITGELMSSEVANDVNLLNVSQYLNGTYYIFDDNSSVGVVVK